jgi:hypothetical protein
LIVRATPTPGTLIPPERPFTGAHIGFRVLSFYDPETDRIVTRIDVKFPASYADAPDYQFKVGLYSSPPGSCILNVPSPPAVLGALGVDVDPLQLASALRALAETIEENAR